VRIATDGDAAFAALEEERPALVITDAIVRAWQELGIPVMLTSASTRGGALPGVTFLGKPFDIDALWQPVAFSHNNSSPQRSKGDPRQLAAEFRARWHSLSALLYGTTL
jgi:hypothetical protein